MADTLAPTVDSLLIDVRANTQGFAADVAAMRGTFDGTLVDGLARAGDVLERGLTGALRKGSLGFEDLRRRPRQARRKDCRAPDWRSNRSR